jgi:hypothetical protein
VSLSGCLDGCQKYHVVEVDMEIKLKKENFIPYDVRL